MVRINPALIPETEVRLLAMSFLEGIREYYSNPENVKKYQEWQQKQKQIKKTLLSV